MNNYKYSLDTSSKKYICPACERKTFVVYIDNETGEPLHRNVGKCDRADNCAHHYTPKQYFSDNNMEREYTLVTIFTKPKPKPSFINDDFLKRTLKGYSSNRLFQFLCKNIGDYEPEIYQAFERYFVGSSKTWNGATVFWQIDYAGRIRTGKIMLYNRITGKRIKEPTSRISWVHKALKLSDFNLCQCFFGEHLLRGNNKTIAIVESEKTAIVASIFYPDMIWLACGGSEGLNIEKCKILKERNVVLYPDYGMFTKWNVKAYELKFICNASVSYFIEKYATETQQAIGFDMADYLLKT